MLVATKGCHPLLSAMATPRMDPASLAQDLRESLDRLGDAQIDLYWLHRDNPAVPVDEILDALDTQRRAGRIRAFGASNWSAARLAAAQAWATRRGVEGFCASQIEWSLATRDRTLPGDPTCLSVLSEDFAYHQQSRLPLVAYSAQAQGFFDTTRVKRPPVYDAPANHARRDRAIALAQRHHLSANHLALGWLTSQAFPVVALVGCRTQAQIVDSMAAADLHLTPDEVSILSGPQRW
jgi:aryl-alcohol dehydrogenase-like predicted oxidoreductase